MGAITHLLDHEARIWRRVETAGRFQESVVTYEEAYASVACFDNGEHAVLGNPGPGLTPMSRRVLFFDVGPTFAYRDVAELISGPNTGQRIEIESIDNVRNHHIELEGSEFRGVLPSDEAEVLS